MNLTGVKIKVLIRLISFGGSRENKTHILPFPPSRDLQHSLACGLISPISSSAFSSLPLSLILLLPLQKDSCDNIGHIQLIQDSLLTLNINSITFAKSLLPYKVTYPLVPEIRIWTSWRRMGIIQPTILTVTPIPQSYIISLTFWSLICRMKVYFPSTGMQQVTNKRMCLKHHKKKKKRCLTNIYHEI